MDISVSSQNTTNPDITLTTEEDINVVVNLDCSLSSAKLTTLSPDIHGSGYISPCSVYSIEADSLVEKDDLQDEEDKCELAERLEQEVKGTIMELWRQRLTQPFVCPSEFEVDYDESEEVVSCSSSSPSSVSVSVAAVLADNESLQTESDSSAAEGKRVRKSALKKEHKGLQKTKFDYSKGTLRRSRATEPQQIDFRGVLKKKDFDKV